MRKIGTRAKAALIVSLVRIEMASLHAKFLGCTNVSAISVPSYRVLTNGDLTAMASSWARELAREQSRPHSQSIRLPGARMTERIG
jgi:hypothetical protein